MRRIALALLALMLLAGVVVYAFFPALLLKAEYARWAFNAGVTRHDGEIAQHRWAWYEGGSGPTVVLVHGFTGSKENWLQSARGLTDQYRVVIPDLPGWGESERKPDGDYGVQAQAERLAAFLAQIDERPVHLVGHSMGGHISGLMVARKLRPVASLSLVSSAGVRFDLNDFARRIIAGGTPFNVQDRVGWERLMRDLFVQPPWLPPRVQDVLIERNVAGHEFHAQLLARMRGETEAFLLQAELSRIAVPTLVLWCESDAVLDVSSVKSFRRGLAASEIEIMPACGHMPMLERPQAVAARLARFFAGIGREPEPAQQSPREPGRGPRTRVARP